MADGILGLGGGGASSLNQETLDKLKEADRVATVQPIEDQIEEITKEGGEIETIAAIKAKANELLESIKLFDLYAKDGLTAFDQKSASATGTAALFDAVNIGKLNVGTTTVNVSQLAQRDVFQSAKIYDPSGPILGSNSDDDKLVISHGGKDFEFSTKDKTYEQLVTEINYNSNFSASLEEVSGGEFRLVIKSKEPGLDNALTIKEQGSLSLGLELNGDTSASIYAASNDINPTEVPAAGTSITINGTTFTSDGSETYEDFVKRIDADENINASLVDGKLVMSSEDKSALVIENDNFNFAFEESNGSQSIQAQNMKATVDGIEYDVSSNSITVDGGLKITAVEVGEASVNVQNDTSSVEALLQDFVTKYNELTAMVDAELYSVESSVEDRSSLRTMMDGIKDKLFGSYGLDGGLNIYSMGFELDKSGVLSLDSEKLSDALQERPEDVKMLFLGVAEKEGLGTQMKTYLDDLDSFEGILTRYEDSMSTRQKNLEEEQKKAQESLDIKYDMMAAQFAAYGTLINQFENQFSGLQLLIQQSVAGS